MIDDSVDLSPLSQRDDAARREARIREIVGATRAAEGSDIFGILAAWTRPALIAAALILAASLPAIVRREPRRPVSTAEILGVPTMLVDLVASTPRPSLDDLARTLGDGSSDDR